MDPKDMFPTELWLEVLSYLPPAACRNLSSTHRILYDLARPLGFTDFTLHSHAHGFQPQKAQLDDALERLLFWTSPTIAPHVRSCTISERSHLWQSSTSKSTSNGRESGLMSAFFERLPHFTGLERLSAAQVRFTQTGLANLCALPALAHVELLRCRIATRRNTDIPVPLTLCVRSFTANFDYHMKQFWISRLSRDTLQELNFDSHRALVGSQMQPFPNVHTLKMDDFPNSIDDTIAILNKFPNLRTFSSSYRRRVLSNLTPAEVLSIFPVLQEYTGARENLHIFVQVPTLTRITLDSRCFPFHLLVAQLRGITSLPNITSLTAGFTTDSDPFSGTELNALFTFFPNLNELRLVLVRMIEGNRSTSQATFLNMLASSPLLPRTLRSLSIEWDCSQYDSSDSETEHVLAAPDPADAPDFAILRPQLTARCPALTEIFLDGYHFLFWWRKTWSVWEATVHTYDDAKFLRAQKYDTCPS